MECVVHYTIKDSRYSQLKPLSDNQYGRLLAAKAIRQDLTELNFHKEQCATVPDGGFDKTIYGVHLEPCYKKFTTIIARLRKRKSNDQEEPSRLKRTRNEGNPSTSGIFPKVCFACKKQRQTIKKKIYVAYAIATENAAAKIKEAAALKEDNKLLIQIMGVNLIAKELMTHKQCYLDYIRCVSEQAEVVGDDKDERAGIYMSESDDSLIDLSPMQPLVLEAIKKRVELNQETYHHGNKKIPVFKTESLPCRTESVVNAMLKSVGDAKISKQNPDNDLTPILESEFGDWSLIVRRYLYTHQECKDFHRVLLTIEGRDGGFDAIRRFGDHARNRKQIINLRTKACQDPMVEVIELCKEQEKNSKTAFIRNVTLAPEKAIFLANDRQHDIERFCTVNGNFSVFGVDPMYNVGSFYVTLSTYRHLMLETKNGVHPVMIGPALIHYKKGFDFYFQLPSNMLRYNRALHALKCIGMDGEVNFSDALKSVFSEAHHLLCAIHMRDNVERKLLDLGIKGEPR
eukprot:Seg1070.14 transcript_id=Seg1070.14/GoldUCD/mRNA.D3Y31 product="hypothetical protein" protein_id=Seg1070.14/GoldUCD/D3Y31